MKNIKIKHILSIIVVCILLISLGFSYNNKIKEEKILINSLEEISKEYEAINILGMNIEEESYLKNLNNKFKYSIDSKDLSESKRILEKVLTLETSVNSRIKEEESEKEELARLESEKKKIAEYEEKKLAEEEKKRKEELALLEDKEKELATLNGNTDQLITSIPKISTTSAAESSNQLISVISTGGSNAELILWQKDNQGTWYEYDRMFARLGENGMKYESSIHEMDLSTPTGVYSLTESFGISQDPGSKIRYRVLDGSEYWVDDETSPYYNTMQFGEPNGRWNSAEHLIRYNNAYKYAVVIDYNRWPVVPGKSSAIFLHVDVGIPTWGCVAVSEDKMIKILNWLNPISNPKIMLAFSYDELYSY